LAVNELAKTSPFDLPTFEDRERIGEDIKTAEFGWPVLDAIGHFWTVLDGLSVEKRKLD